ncbi:MAG: hypothetical protein NZ482_10205 [Gloeomargarita sp. SKYG98]|nr:hypothetical protein [Gloeomargarita sp. SKYG98]
MDVVIAGDAMPEKALVTALESCGFYVAGVGGPILQAVHRESIFRCDLMLGSGEEYE